MTAANEICDEIRRWLRSKANRTAKAAQAQNGIVYQPTYTSTYTDTEYAYD